MAVLILQLEGEVAALKDAALEVLVHLDGGLGVPAVGLGAHNQHAVVGNAAAVHGAGIPADEHAAGQAQQSLQRGVIQLVQLAQDAGVNALKHFPSSLLGLLGGVGGQGQEPVGEDRGVVAAIDCIPVQVSGARFVGYSVAGPVGQAAAQHLVADQRAAAALGVALLGIASGEDVLGVLLELVIILPMGRTIDEAIALVRAGRNVRQVCIAIGRVVEDGRAVLGEDLVFAMDAAGKTAAQSLGHVAGNNRVLNGQLAIGLHINAAAAQVGGGVGLVVQNRAAGNFAVALNVNAAALAGGSRVAQNQAAVHVKISRALTSIVDKHAAAFRSLVVGNDAAIEHEGALGRCAIGHINAAALAHRRLGAIPAFFLNLLGVGAVARDGAAIHHELAAIHRNAAARGSRAVAGDGAAVHFKLAAILHKNASAAIIGLVSRNCAGVHGQLGVLANIDSASAGMFSAGDGNVVIDDQRTAIDNSNHAGTTFLHKSAASHFARIDDKIFAILYAKGVGRHNKHKSIQNKSDSVVILVIQSGIQLVMDCILVAVAIVGVGMLFRRAEQCAANGLIALVAVSVAFGFLQSAGHDCCSLVALRSVGMSARALLYTAAQGRNLGIAPGGMLVLFRAGQLRFRCVALPAVLMPGRLGFAADQFGLRLRAGLTVLVRGSLFLFANQIAACFIACVAVGVHLFLTGQLRFYCRRRRGGRQRAQAHNGGQNRRQKALAQFVLVHFHLDNLSLLVCRMQSIRRLGCHSVVRLP